MMTKRLPIEQKIVFLAKLRGLTQVELARRLDMQASHLNHYLKGHGDVRSSSFLKILGELGIDMSTVIDQEIAKRRTPLNESQMSAMDVFETLVAKMDKDDRQAFVNYTMKFALVHLGSKARPQIRKLRELMS